MKKILLLSNLFLLIVGAIQAQNSNMVFFTEKGEKFILFVNGNQQNEKPMSNVKVEQMPSSIYQVRIVFEDQVNGVIDDKVTLNPSTEKTWKIRMKDLDTRNKVNNGLNSAGLPNATNTQTKFVIRALSEIPISGIVQNNNSDQQIITYQPQGYGYGTNVNTNINTNPNNMQVGTNIGMNTDPNGNVNINMNMGGFGNPTVTTQTTNTTTTTTTNGTSFQQTHQITNTGHRGCPAPMSTALFNVEKNKMKMQKTEAGRLIVCKKIINTKCLNSQQVYELISLMSYSSNKLEAAKLAYTRTFDPDNYEVVYNAFAISNQVEELDKYIQSVNAGWGTTSTTTTVNTPNNVNWNVNTNTNGNTNTNTNWNTNNTNTQTNTNWNTQNNTMPDYNGPVGCPNPMSSSSFETAKSSIQSKSFENTKFEVAKQIIGQNCMTSAQVLQICKLFGFEQTKLDFAKFAYSRTYDKANYFKVNDAFGFESSITELQEYIKGE